MSTDLDDADYQRLLAFRIELRRFLRHSEQVAGELGLTPALHQLLLAIRGDAGPTGPTIGTVADALSVRHHTAVELAQRAEHLDLVHRTRDDQDRRQVRLELTVTGGTRLEELSRRHLPAIAQLAHHLTDVIDDSDPRSPPSGHQRATRRRVGQTRPKSASSDT